MKPIQIGLTGSIGMGSDYARLCFLFSLSGKSAVANHFRFLGFPVFDADATVHMLYADGGGAVGPIRERFPGAVADNRVDRAALGGYVLSSPSALKELESIIHPLVAQERREFYEAACHKSCLAVVYDIPLLFENRDKHNIDYSLVVTASSDTQRTRVLARPGMTPEKFESILQKQMPDAVKRQMADFVINTDYRGYAQSRAQVSSALCEILERSSEVWHQWKFRGNYPKNHIVSEPPRMRDFFDVVVFDLDNTLVPVHDPISAASRIFTKDVREHMPLSAEIILKTLREQMEIEKTLDPLIGHDYTEMRVVAMRRLAQPHGEEGQVEAIVQRFIEARSAVSEYLYPDSVPCLRMLTEEEGLPIAMLTNGNAEICTKGSALETKQKQPCELGAMLSLSMHAGQLGAMKPSPVPFIALAQRLNTHPSRVLYVGDSFVDDVEGAKGVGMHSAFLCRQQAPATAAQSPQENVLPDTVFTRLLEEVHATSVEDGPPRPHIELNSLDPAEFRTKVIQHMTSLIRNNDDS